MSDFLGNLAAKALRLSEALEPQLPGYFEPVRTEGWPGYEPIFDRQPGFDERTATRTVVESAQPSRSSDQPTSPGQWGGSDDAAQAARHEPGGAEPPSEPDRGQVGFPSRLPDVLQPSAARPPAKRAPREAAPSAAPLRTGADDPSLARPPDGVAPQPPRAPAPIVDGAHAGGVRLSATWVAGPLGAPPPTAEAAAEPLAWRPEPIAGQQKSGDSARQSAAQAVTAAASRGGTAPRRKAEREFGAPADQETAIRLPEDMTAMPSTARRVVLSSRQVRVAETVVPREQRPSSGEDFALIPRHTPTQVAPVQHAEPEALSSADRAAAATTAPIIHVTIGRIEVRAVLPTPPPPRRASPQSPKLSLDEYLKQRDGGQR